MTGLIFHAHKSGAKEFLIVLNTIKGSHDGVHLALARINGHLGRGFKGLHNFLMTMAVGFHSNITSTLTHSALKIVLDLLGG